MNLEAFKKVLRIYDDHIYRVSMGEAHASDDPKKTLEVMRVEFGSALYFAAEREDD